VRRLTLLAVLALAGCGSDSGLGRSDAIAAANGVCENAGVPAINARAPAKLQARFAQLSAQQEAREVRDLRAVDWRDGEFRGAVDVWARAVPHLAAFSRALARGDVDLAERERATYGRLLTEWRTRAGALGLDVCRQFGWVY
jgi:hypothetical protein